MEGSVCLSGSNCKTSYRCARSEVLLALTMVIVLFWHVTAWSFVEISEESTTSNRFYHSTCKFLPDYMALHWKFGDHYLGIVVNSAVSDCSVWMHQRGLHHHFSTACLQWHINHVLEGAAIFFNIPPCASVLTCNTFRMQMHVVNGTFLCLYSTYCSCATQQ